MSLMTSKQLVDALVVVKSEQSKDECHNNLTMSLEKAKGRKYEKITKVSLIEINENGVIKKIMYPAPADAVSDVTNIPNTTASRARSSKSRTKTSQSASKTSNQSNISCNTTPLPSIAPNPSLVQNFAILPRASNPPQNVFNIPLQMNQTNLVNNKPLILNNMSNSSGLQSPQTIIIRNAQPNNCSFNVNNNTNQMMLQQNQVMLQQQPPIIIQQPLMNPGLQQNIVYQSPGNQQVIQIQGNSFQSNNSGQCWVQNQFIPSQNGQQQIIQVSNNPNNNTTVQYQFVNPQRNFIQQSNLNVAANSNPPILIQPQPLNNAIVIPPNSQRTLYINQPTSLTPQMQNHNNIQQQQPNIITVNSNNNNMNNIKSNQMIIQVNNNNAPQAIQQSMLPNKISNIVYSMQTQTVTNPMVISNANITMPANNYASQKSKMVEIRPSIESSPANTTEKDVNKKIAIPRLNKTTLNQVNKNFKCKKVGGAVKSNPPPKPHLNVIAPVSDEASDVDSKANLNVNLFDEEKTDQDDVYGEVNKLNVESQTNGVDNNDDNFTRTLVSSSKNLSPTNNNQGSSSNINNSSNSNNKTSLYNKNAPFILFNKLSTAQQKQNMDNEAKQLEAMKLYRQIRPKPAVATTSATAINNQVKENSELVKENNNNNSENGENLNDKISAKRKKLAIVENDLAIAQMLSNEDDSDSEGEDVGSSMQRMRKGRKTTSTDKSYKCKNSLSQASLRHYPRTRSSTKLNKP